MRYGFILLTFLSFNAIAQDTAQTDTAHILSEAVVSGYVGSASSLNIHAYSLATLNEKTPFNLTDALAAIPGISQMTTGNSIAKPVIRGLYGNRILVLYSGMRFDNQQWQDEHGLGLSQIGIDRVEVIKGPASLLYGSDAMGGVINVIEEKPVADGSKLDAGTQLFSNTLGTLTDIGYTHKKGSKWYRIRLGAESHADYTDGNNQRVLNSRNQGYYLKAGMGWRKSNWTQENTYNFSLNQFGFIMNDLDSVFKPDNRWTRAMNGPHHIVILNMANSRNTFQLSNSSLQLNAGVQSNIRMEDEGGGQISLNMHLLSALQSLRWEKQLRPSLSFVANQQFTYERNTNYGGRILIPDATFIEGNLSGYFRWIHRRIIIEAGAGINDKNIKTIATRSLNMPGEEIQPFQRNNLCVNGMTGLSYTLAEGLHINFNTATGSRSPNLAELSSNGLHEGVYRYEIGKPNLQIEQNINTDLSIIAVGKHWNFTASAYYNRFFNYIYLAPTNQLFYGFPVYRYRQQDALIYGCEAAFTVAPARLRWLELKETFTTTTGLLNDGSYMPFIPANKSTTSLRFSKKLDRKISAVFVEPAFMYTFMQDRPAQFETPTGDYALFNIYSGITLRSERGNWNLGLSCTNIANVAYTDHLSRLKYYGLNNQGRCIILSIRKQMG